MLVIINRYIKWFIIINTTNRQEQFNTRFFVLVFCYQILLSWTTVECQRLKHNQILIISVSDTLAFVNRELIQTRKTEFITYSFEFRIISARIIIQWFVAQFVWNIFIWMGQPCSCGSVRQPWYDYCRYEPDWGKKAKDRFFGYVLHFKPCCYNKRR